MKFNFPQGRNKDAKERKKRREQVVTRRVKEVLRWMGKAYERRGIVGGQ